MSTCVSKLPNPPPPWLSRRPTTRNRLSVQTYILANGIAVPEELFSNVGTEHDDLVPVIHVGEFYEHPAGESEIPGGQVFGSYADYLGGGTLAARRQCSEGADLRRGGEYGRSVNGINERIGVSKGELGAVSLRLNKEEIRSQSLDDAGDLFRRAATNGHERDYGSDTYHDAQKGES